MIVLAGDIGGTNARLATVRVEPGGMTVLDERRYPSEEFPGLGPIVRRFLDEGGTRPARACFGVACPVVGDDCTAPNLPWTINARSLAAEIGIRRTAIINDFVAVGYGVERLGPADLVTLQPGHPVPGGPIALIGAGTGLGEGFLLRTGDHYHVLASEGGHADFAPRGAIQTRLLEFLRGEYGRVSWERLLSGPGLVNIYRGLAAAGVAAERPAVREEMAHDDPAAVITRHAAAGDDPLCDRTLEVFVEVYGAQAGNLALTVVATGGVYLTGGIAPRIIERLRGPAFLAAFREKGRLTEVVSAVPVHVIIASNVALLGAAQVASRLSD
jgi:glucokinase